MGSDPNYTGVAVGSASFAAVAFRNPCYGGEGMKVGKFTGDGGATQAVTGAGFTPDAALIIDVDDSHKTWIKTNDHSTTYCNNIPDKTYVDDAIVSLDSDGFTVGDSDGMNTSAKEYIYILWAG